MSIEKVTERIISDAEQSAAATVAGAKKRADEIIAAAEEEAQRARAGVEAEVAARVKAITEGKLAQARLDGAKILLAEKRRVIDSVYERARKELSALSEAQTVEMSDRLLQLYAEEGDEISFSPDFKYAKQVSELDEVKAKKLKVKLNDRSVDGGFALRGRTSDKDLSFAALLTYDRERNEAVIAADIFGGEE